LPSQPLTLRLPFWKVRFELPHHKGALRRLINLIRNGQATKRQLFLCSFLNIFNLLSFGIIGDSEPCPSARKLPNASVDFELPELQENIPPQ
jgi:hypothetical protein